MKRLLIHLITLLVLGTTTHSCVENLIDQQQEEVLPPITTTGEGTFGCLVNGELWLPKGGDFGQINPRLDVVPEGEGHSIQIRADSDFDELNRLIRLRMVRVGETSQFDFSSPIEDSDRISADYDDRQACKYLDLEDIVTISVALLKFDIEEKIVSGTFEFTLEKEDCERIEVTDGRFDLRYF